MMNTVTFCFLYTLVIYICSGDYSDGAVYRQNFDGDDDSIEDYFKGEDEYVDIKEYDDNKVARITYEPGCCGTERVSEKLELTSSQTRATLTFDVKLDSDWEWTKGGKMMGLYGGTGTSGCKDIDEDGWSVRMMWNGEGYPYLYIYHQDRENDCGDNWYNEKFAFTRNQWHRIQIEVQLNSDEDEDDGYAVLYADGEQLVKASNLRISGNLDDALIDGLYFNTFYGGGSSSWTPENTNYAIFDNFVVWPGKKLSDGDDAECELEKKGIYNYGSDICCDRECGSCGGSGCGSLPGGNTKCCSTQVKTEGSCDDQDAPCVY